MSFERILTTHAGSLPRPEALLRLLFDEASGRPVDPVRRDAALKAAVRECVRAQLDAGLDLISDGEMSKPSYATYAKDRLTGYGGEGHMPSAADLAEFPTYARRLFADPGIASLRTPSCIGPVAYQGRAALERDLVSLRQALPSTGTRAFVTAASPGVVALFLENAHYPTEDAYLEALASAMHEEYRAIVQAGFELQIDAPDLAMGRHMTFAARSLDQFRRAVGRHIALIDAATADLPAEHVRIHVCWGNYEGPHHRDVELEQIVDLLVQARPAGLSFPAANPRHEHEWRVWQDVRLPDDKVLIPGVVDSTTNFIEHAELVAERIQRFVDVVGPERVIAGTDCGFGTFAGLARVDPAIVWAKLAALVQGARLATERLARPRPSRAQLRASSTAAR
jgi:5-methyltetrahydropteroyltriglutamate--homocysteine methyltransferase